MIFGFNSGHPLSPVRRCGVQAAQQQKRNNSAEESPSNPVLQEKLNQSGNVSFQARGEAGAGAQY